MKILTIIGLAILVLILLTVAFLGIGSQDWISYTATGSETLSPAGTSTGHALVLYDPGLSGVARGAAVMLADDLRQNGYNVTLAGVRSTAAANAIRLRCHRCWWASLHGSAEQLGHVILKNTNAFR